MHNTLFAHPFPICASLLKCASSCALLHCCKAACDAHTCVVCNSSFPVLQPACPCASPGAWGCFDEFNRIPVAVLSVCSTQYKTVLDAIRARKERFLFEDVEIPLKPTVMAFITMNPGYPGRAELPESLKV